MDGKDIQHLRDALGMTQEQFAQILGTAVATISRWENDKNVPRSDQMEMLKTLTTYIDKSEKERKELTQKLLVSNAVGVPVYSFLKMGAIALTGLLAGGVVLGLVNGLWENGKKEG